MRIVKPGAVEHALSKLNIAADLKRKLVARGIPANEVRFVHEAKTREARFGLCQAANDGLVRVVVVSTQKLGTGANVQKRLAALHHLDAAWRPMDLEHFVVGSTWLTAPSREASTGPRVGRSAYSPPTPTGAVGRHVRAHSHPIIWLSATIHESRPTCISPPPFAAQRSVRAASPVDIATGIYGC